MAVEKIWKLREGTDEANVKRLSSELGVDPVLAELLVQRGIHTFEQARSFFRPTLENLNDPFLMTDMDKAVILPIFQHPVGQGGFSYTVPLTFDHIGFVFLPIVEEQILHAPLHRLRVTLTQSPIFLHKRIGGREEGGGFCILSENHEACYLLIQTVYGIELPRSEKVVHTGFAACIPTGEYASGLHAYQKKLILVFYIRSSILLRIFSHCSRILPKS